jgi:hypothetical protein
MPMVVNGLELPTAFVQLLNQPDVPENWMLKQDQDAYGNYWQTSIFELYTNQKRIAAATMDLAIRFPEYRTPAEIEAENASSVNLPGFIPSVTDFSEIIQFGEKDGAAPFCFDFRANAQKASVIVWDGNYWRRVAPGFDSFLALIKPLDWREYAERHDPSLLREIDENAWPPSSEVVPRCQPSPDLQARLPGVEWDQEAPGDHPSS